MEHNYKILLYIKQELPVLFNLIKFQERITSELWKYEISSEKAKRLNAIVDFFFLHDSVARARANVGLFV